MENIENIDAVKEQHEETTDSSLELIDILSAAADFLDSPESQEKMSAFNEIKQRTVVRSFLPLRRKAAIVNKILKDIQESDSDIYDFGSAYEIALTFDGLLAYTNINQDISAVLKDYDFYDILWASGYCDMILEYCEKDYKRICSMTERLISYQNIGELFDALDNINYESIDDLNKAIDRFKLDINPEAIHDIATIVASQDNATKEMNQIIENAAANLVKTAGEDKGNE